MVLSERRGLLLHQGSPVGRWTCAAAQAIAVIDAAVADRGVRHGTLTLGTGDGTAYTSRASRGRLAGHEITHYRGGYRDPERAFIESWYSKFKVRCVWREECETLTVARAKLRPRSSQIHSLSGGPDASSTDQNVPGNVN